MWWTSAIPRGSAASWDGSIAPSDEHSDVTDNSYRAVWPLSELAEGAMHACVAQGREIVVCHTRAGVFALDNICTHAHARLSEGRLRGTRLICPLHGASYDARNGSVLGAPAVQPLVVHKVRVLDGMIEVAIDPAATPQPLVGT
jgi:3-phenylpropionate/trans-cinnamate dioxygenase ferredoxin subunit